MDLSLKIAKILRKLINGEVLPNSSAKGKLIEELVAENIILRTGNRKKTLHLQNEKGLHTYLSNQLQITNLNDYILLLEQQESTRAESVKVTSNSKISRERTFKGFLVNAYHSIQAELNGQNINIEPQIGRFIFIYDYETFKIPKDITVVGIENASNFRYIEKQKYLFEHIKPLFVSRYPQNQSKDFIKWMQSIPNNYLHFGDFDLAGISIYLHEYKKHLKEKARFFIPENIQEALRNNGNRKLYNLQKENFEQKNIQEDRLLSLLELIHAQKKGLEQEYYIET